MPVPIPVSMSRTCRPLAASQSRTIPHPAVASVRPSRVYSARKHQPRCPSRARYSMSPRVEASHSLSRSSPPAVARKRPSGLNWRWITRLELRERAVATPRATSQTLISLEVSPVARTRPSGLKARLATGQVCPRSVWRTAPVATSQTMADWSRLPVASIRPSGL